MSQLNFAVVGQIGETTSFFTQRLDGVKELTLDLAKVTYISSIGVKAWIMWTVRIPANCQVKMFNVPYVIVSQASMTLGFVNPKMRIESMCVPFLCGECDYEENRVLTRATHYEYPQKPKAKWVRLPETGPCPKCRKTAFEPDFMQDKTFKFLDY